MYTAPESSPASIDDAATIAASTSAVYADLSLQADEPSSYLLSFDAIIVACFSYHPLVAQLYWRLGRRVVVTGIFEAGCLSAVSFVQPPVVSCLGCTEESTESCQRESTKSTKDSAKAYSWGIVTTGHFWEAHLTHAVETLLGTSSAFAGVFSTGLNASDFHHMTAAAVRKKLVGATRRLLDTETTSGRRVSAVVMGCAGMSGLDAVIRETAVEYYGQGADELVVVDGVKAGLLQAVKMVQERELFGGYNRVEE